MAKTILAHLGFHVDMSMHVVFTSAHYVWQFDIVRFDQSIFGIVGVAMFCLPNRVARGCEAVPCVFACMHVIK